MTIIMSYSACRYLWMNIVRHKTFATIKSKHDEQINQALLKRLKKISVIGGKKTLPPNQPSKYDHEEIDKLNFKKLDRMIGHHIEDPLTWNAYILSRVYKLPERYCEAILEYVKPMLFFVSNQKDEPERLIKNRVVIDVDRLKSDESYLVIYKRILFPDVSKQELPVFALQDTPEALKLEKSLSEQ